MKKRSKKENRRKNSTAVIYILLRVLVTAMAVVAVITQQYESLYFCVLTLILFFAPSLVERTFAVELPSVLEIMILLLIFAAEICGELNSFYLKYPFWDTMLHTISGFIFAAIGFALVDIFNRIPKTKFNLSPLYLAVAAFCFSMTIGVLWEFLEFGCDAVLGTDMQKDTVINSISSVTLNGNAENHAVQINDIHSVVVNGELLPIDGYLDIGLIDTMKDLFVNFVGAVIFSVLGGLSAKHRDRSKFLKIFVPRLASETAAAETAEENNE